MKAKEDLVEAQLLSIRISPGNATYPPTAWLNLEGLTVMASSDDVSPEVWAHLENLAEDGGMPALLFSTKIQFGAGNRLSHRIKQLQIA